MGQVVVLVYALKFLHAVHSYNTVIFICDTFFLYRSFGKFSYYKCQLKLWLSRDLILIPTLKTNEALDVFYFKKFLHIK